MAETVQLLTTYAESIATRDWTRLRAVLADTTVVTLLHTGEQYDADGFVAFNRDYDGGWVFTADEVVDGGERGVLRAHVELEGETFHVATFASLDATSDRLTDLVEVWTEAVSPHPARG
ncbi:hypothetical protein [Nocardioides flavescens]|uniref:SnoaL-like domain-containing protein n=1 Tax=Nocardioides flavescens TaxID=2691959 RepID=A0A6L7F1C4_9ACTN|nr:hypothetical protein [Nocardioides flavescens]MXG88764.1 hypothetical protein [Nocardioides flavescens]